jgi:signal peptide peptidase SppA
MNWRDILRLIPLKRFRHPPPKVAVLRLSGIIGGLGPVRQGLTLAGLESTIERAFAVPDLSAVALSVNSPGGSPVQSELIAARIRDLAAEKEVKVLAFCEDVAASGGYWLAAAADEVFVQDSSILGSIGVISSGFGFQGLIERFGIERRIHTAGDKKSMLDPFKPEDPQDVARLKSIQEDIHEHFKNWVVERRGDKLTADPEALFSGEFWTGRRAVELGLADGRGELRATLRERYGDKVKIVPVKLRKPWWKGRVGLQGGLTGTGAPPSLLPTSWATDLIAALEERSLWGRFGL